MHVLFLIFNMYSILFSIFNFQILIFTFFNFNVAVDWQDKELVLLNICFSFVSNLGTIHVIFLWFLDSWAWSTVSYFATLETRVFSLLFVKSQQDLKPELIITFDKAYAYPTKLITDDAFLQIKKVSYILVFCFIFLIFFFEKWVLWHFQSCHLFTSTG